MKRWNIINLLMNDQSNPPFEFSVTAQDEDGDDVELVSDSSFRLQLMTRYWNFNILTPSYYDTEAEQHIELCQNISDAVSMLHAIFMQWVEDRAQGFYKLYEALRAEYNPVHNYDMTMISTTDYKGSEKNTVTPSGSEKVTLTKLGTEKHETEKSGSETHETAFTGTEKNTNTPSGTETRTTTKEGSEQTDMVKGAHLDTVQNSRTTFDSDTDYDTDKTTTDMPTYTDTDTLSFTDREDATTLSFDQRKTEDEKSFTDRKDTLTDSFTNRKDTLTDSFTDRKDETETTFNQRKTEDEKTFTDRQDEINEHKFGNLGVTTSQQMISSQFPLTEMDKLQSYIINTFVHECLVI